jgi:hypothetical protein
MNQLDRDYIDRIQDDLERLKRSDRTSNLVFLVLGLLLVWGVTLAALLGFLR